MVTPTVDRKSFPHTATSPTKQDSYALENEDDVAEHLAPIAVESASRTLHLVNLDDGNHTLCGLPLSQVLTGGYCEHLDGQIDDPQFERAIFARDGREAESCEECLIRHPSVLVSVSEDER